MDTKRISSGRRIVATPDQQTPSDGYLARLVKYVPTEFITIFLTINGFVTSGQLKLSTQQYWIVFAILLAANAIYIWRATSQKGQSPATTQIVVATILYVVFAYSIGGPFKNMSNYRPELGAIILPIALFIAGFIVPKPQPVALEKRV
ncbi:MAG: hypothetical protein IVW57_09520 [Ktedonobacterales bacterium]|nr:hypothetical protein [Ktedonobacterales bacterium]